MKDQLFITLMKIRRNLSHRDLAFRYAVSTTTISKITTTWILLLHEIFYEGTQKRICFLWKTISCACRCVFLILIAAA